MLEIGITGGIGSGKSVVCKMLEVLGYPVFYADIEAKRVMTEDAALVAGIQAAFGKEAYDDQGALNRKYLADQVFHHPDKLAQLNALVHPATISAYQLWVREQKSDLVFKEAALLFESGSYRLSAVNVLVSSPIALRIKRVMLRDHISAEAVKSRMDTQMDEESKRKLADFVIVNDEKQALIPQVLNLREKLLEQCAGMK